VPRRLHFYDRKVQAHGYTRLLSLGKVIPEDWRYVRIFVVKQTPTEVHIIIKKLLGVETNALFNTPCTRGGQDT
jgi:xanthine dehydrogenase molybdopterin-binding subunit B